MPQNPGSGLSGNTSVTLFLSSTANDQLSSFETTLSSLTLTSESGRAVTLFPAGRSAEFIHLNGMAEPLVTVSVPQDVYKSASMSFGVSTFAGCANLDGLGGVAAGGGGGKGQYSPTVHVPNPITVTGSAMGLVLRLLVSQSITVTNSCHGFIDGTETFNLEPVTLSAQPTNIENGKVTNLDGEISALSASPAGFTVTLADGQNAAFNSNSSTVYQGVSGFGALAVGTFVDMDAALQADGSLLASRVAVEDSNPTNENVAIGPVIESMASQPVLMVFLREQQGPLVTNTFCLYSLRCALLAQYDSSNALFQISGGSSNLSALPFAALFDATHVFDGQIVYVTTHQPPSLNFSYVPASTITLLPQTLNGTITETSTSGGFQIYGVTLASYDLPTLLAGESRVAQSYSLNSPSTVEVYIDNNTELLNHKPLAVGSVFRFTGLLFDDDGVMRMDCAQVTDGVTE